MENIIANLDNYAMIALMVIGSLVMIVEGLKGLAKLTKTTRDDAVLSKISKGLNSIANLLDKVTPVSRDKPTQ